MSKIPSSSVAQSKRATPPAKSGESTECCDQNSQLHSNSSMSIMKRHPSTTWTRMADMPKEIAMYAIDKPVKTDVKARDMQMHSTNQNLDPFERSALFLKSDQISEKIFVASKTMDLIQMNMERYFKEIFPGMDNELKQETEELHSAAASGFGRVYNFLTTKNPTNANTVLQLIFRCLESKNQNICEAWSTSVLDLVNTMGPKELEKDFLPLVLAKAKSPLPNVRKTVAIMIKFLIIRSPPLAKPLAGTITALLEDPIPVVRGTMCQQLGPIYHAMQSKEGLTNHINRISKDNDPYVKKSLIITIGGIYKYPDMNPLHELILQLLKRTIKEAFIEGNIEILAEFTSYIGEMAKVMTEAGSLNADSKLWFLDAFIQLSRYGLAQASNTEENLPVGFLNFRANMGYGRRHSLVESLVSSGAPPTVTKLPSKQNVMAEGWKVRANTAKEFTNFFKFAKPLMDFKLGILPLINDLIHDPNPTVRAAMAANYWSIMELLGNSGHLLHGEFTAILSDDSLEVVEGIAPHIAKILKIFVNGKILSPDQATPHLVEIGGAIIFCEERLSQANSWRIHTQFLSQLTVLPFCLPGDYIYNNFVPDFFHRLLHLRHLPARMSVADAIVCCLRNCRRAKQREEIRRKIKESFAKGKSVQDRMLFLYMSKRIIDTFSRKYFREHFFDCTLDLAEDEVSNVRMKAVKMMPDMKNTLQRADDDKLLQKLDAAAARLRERETDMDVLNSLDEAIKGMEKIGIRFAGDKAPKTKADAEDEAKQKEEAYIESLEAAMEKKPTTPDPGIYYKKPTVQSVKPVPSPIKPTPVQPKAAEVSVPVSAVAGVTVIGSERRFRRRTFATGEIASQQK